MSDPIRLIVLRFSTVLLFQFLVCGPLLAQAVVDAPSVSPTVRQHIQEDGKARVIVELRMNKAHRAEGRMNRSKVRDQRREIANGQGRLIGKLRSRGARVVHRFKTVPFLALEVDAAALAELEASGIDVARIAADRLAKPMLAESVPLIEADAAWSSGLDGSGYAIAVLDTGVDRDHEFLAGKVIAEACFSSPDAGAAGGDCPNGEAVQIGSGAGVDCTYAPYACRHGTHVAGIAAGAGPDFSGVAPGADLIAIQVFHSTNYCSVFEEVPCARAYFSDVAAGLEHVYDIADQYDIAAVNLSIGASLAYGGPCDADDPELVAIIDNLESVGIATVVASGNGGVPNAIDFPACISSAISVGATTKWDDVAGYSNVSTYLDLFAPGDYINSSVPGNQYAYFGGTSMATPHVAGAVAIIRQATPELPVVEILASLVNTGRPVVDPRTSSLITVPRIRVSGAIGFEAPVPVIDSITPASTVAWRSGASFSVNGSGFVRGSVIYVDGAAVPTSFVDVDELAGQLSAEILATLGSELAVTVTTPPPGGGTSNSATLVVRQPVLSVGSGPVPGGEDLTVTLTDGPGSTWAWLGLFKAGDLDINFVEFNYIGDGVTDTTWTVPAPDEPGEYEFRLFLDTGYQLIATSGTVTVDPAPPPPPPDPTQATLSVDATLVEAGSPITVTLSDGFGGQYDWLALAAVGAPDTSYIQTQYVGAGVTDTTWTVSAPGNPGQYEFRLFIDNGFTRVATSEAVVVDVPPPPPPDPNQPTLALSSPTVVTGETLTVTLSGGAGGAQDWLAFAEVGSADSTYVQYAYVGAGVTDTTWTVSAPANPGQYEFRLFLNNGYERAATSDVVVVELPPPPEPTDVSMEVDVVSAFPGDPVTLTLSGAPGGATDWLALAEVGSADTGYVQYEYVGAGVMSRTWSVNMPSTPGDYEFRLFLDNGYERAATSATITVLPPPPDPSEPELSVDVTSAQGGDVVTLTLTNAPGGATDWLAFAAVESPDTTYLEYTYVGGGVTTRTWAVTMPSTPGDYEFRLFLDNGYERAATSVTVSIGSAGPDPDAPELTVDTTAATPGQLVTMTVANGPGGAGDWLALAATGAPDSSYLQYTYIGAGVDSRTWTVSMPIAPGDYEFRLYLNDGYERAATSPIVTVAP
ncbi:MAG: S8 family peptidase [Gammaproteobacteria bacterium]